MNGNRFILLSKLPIVWAALLSLISHVLMLMVPLSEQKSPKKTESPEIVQIIQLPPTIDRPSPAQSIIAPEPSPTPIPSQQPQPSLIVIRPSTQPTTPPISKSVVQNDKPPIVPTTPPPNTPTSPTPTIPTPVPLSLEQIQSAWQSSTNQTRKQYADRVSDPSVFISVSPETYFESPQLFYDKKGEPLVGFDGKPIQIEKETPEQVFQNYDTNLKKAGFTISRLPDYGGGLLYEIKQESTIYYLNILKTPGKGMTTIVVIWTIRPGTQPAAVQK